MRTFIFILVAVALLSSCDKIVADDITAETPVLILPMVNDTVGINPVHFKWEAMEGATKYHLEIATPSFAAIDAFVLDSVISGTDFFFALDSNEYELKLTALNGGYESQVLGPIKFWVGVQASSTNSNVVLTSPTNGGYVSATFNNQFSWNAVLGASSYEFSVRQGSSFATGTLINTQNNISTSTYTVPAGLLTEGEYHWGVKAYLSASETPISLGQFFVDAFAPNVAILSSPTDFSFGFVGITTFSWGNGTDPGLVHSPVTSTLEIGTDSGFGTIVETVNIVGNSANVNLLTGTYFWRVSNADQAGNVAGSSNVYQLTVN